ncbi:MAG: imidazole glycerol-phosphate synthase subunit HisH [Pseudonocardiales bacterium]|nr:imidazole glycerol-phosphate synthase subunit HisH [Pseudonocardiales bacterium]
MLDYGSGNVRSAVRAIERVAATFDDAEPSRVELTADRDRAAAADALIVPGVGAFAACMAGLNAVEAGAILSERLAAGRPVLGICVGMQVLFESGIEHGVETAGLGLLPGRVEKLAAPVIPHMGWNTVAPPADSMLFAGIQPGTRFYFVHSYAVHPGGDHPGGDRGDRDAYVSSFAPTITEHGEPFISAVESPLLCATQFHPEKSGAAGQALLRNWLSSVRRLTERTPVSQGES